jgi:hypothetical protein
MTVGVPILVLALWVRPGPSRSGILAQTLRVSIPLSIGVAAVGLPVYVTALLNGASTEIARTMLTSIACFLGIGALVLVPIAADDRGRIRMPAWVRTTILVGALGIAYLVVLSTQPGRSFFQLAPLPWEIVASLIAIAAAWTAAVIGIHKTRIVQRGIDVLIDAWRSVRPVRGAAAGLADR